MASGLLPWLMNLPTAADFHCTGRWGDWSRGRPIGWQEMQRQSDDEVVEAFRTGDLIACYLTKDDQVAEVGRGPWSDSFALLVVTTGEVPDDDPRWAAFVGKTLGVGKAKFQQWSRRTAKLFAPPVAKASRSSLEGLFDERVNTNARISARDWRALVAASGGSSTVADEIYRRRPEAWRKPGRWS